MFFNELFKRINRIRLEFKDYQTHGSTMDSHVLIESDWNLKHIPDLHK